MKLTKSKLKQLIKEEIENMNEADDWLAAARAAAGAPRDAQAAAAQKRREKSAKWVLQALAQFPKDSELRKHAEKNLGTLVYPEPGTQMTLGHVTGKEIGLEEAEKPIK